MRAWVRRLGDRYVRLEPWRLADALRAPRFDDEPGFEAFSASCRAIGLPVRVGRSRLPGSPRTILVDASGLVARKDDVLTRLWERFRVDSLLGGWDYVEPVLFGTAAGLVIERWTQEIGAEAVTCPPEATVARFHGWTAAAGLLELAARAPSVGTVLSLEGTALGRALAGAGRAPEDGVPPGRTPESEAEALGVRSKHSLEAACVLACDVLAATSGPAADEVEALHRRRPDVITRDLVAPDVLDELHATSSRGAAREALLRLAAAMTGEDLRDALLVATAAPYEPRISGLDTLLDALGRLHREEGRRIVLFAAAPAGTAGPRRELRRRLAAGKGTGLLSLGASTHAIFEPAADPFDLRVRSLGLSDPTGRVRVLHVGGPLDALPGLGVLPSAAALTRGVDLAVMPAFRGAGGVRALEALALGVPAWTSDRTGLGALALELGPDAAPGLRVLPRRARTEEEVVADLADALRAAAAPGAPPPTAAETCRATAARLGGPDRFEAQEAAATQAAARARDRELGAARAVSLAPVPGAFAGGRSGVPGTASAGAAPLPPALAGLARLARNLAWCTDPEATALLEGLAPARWDALDHDPLAVLSSLTAEEVATLAADPTVTTRLRSVLSRLDAHLAAPSADATDGGPTAARPIAYFCAEFGLHESLPIYNGGLGVLAGDHLKAANDLRLPLVAVGLFYRRGYLRQRVSVRGEQVPLPVENDPRRLPVELVRDADGAPITVHLELPGTTLTLVAWRVAVGRIPLYLLDADLPENRTEDRAITHQLYGGDQELRLRQEIVLGRGGVRLLGRLGIEPSAVHLNEGHAAFAPLERVGRLVREEGLTFDEAAVLVRSSTVFTTHTPVPAGHDRFPEPLLRRYFADVEPWLGLPWERFYALGQAGNDRDGFNMTYLGLRLSAVHNGVSRLHGAVSQRLLRPVWPGLLESEVPVGSITNGVHLATWTGPAMSALLGATTRGVTGDDFATKAAGLESRELWRVLSEARRRLLVRVRENLEGGFAERHDDPALLSRMLDGLDERSLLIGFARRFATYKRADLVLRDLDKVEALVGRADRPVRLLFAGKAHPNDRAGQTLLQRVVAAARSPGLVGKVFFLEDYDMDLARALVQGVDVWLNNPVRLEEASGTSGMKVAVNGGLNVSIRDGWWDEACDGTHGWAIGNGATGAGREAEDGLDAAALHRVLADEVVPLFFDRDADGLPRGWLDRVRRSLHAIPPVFDARRMVAEYRDAAYVRLARASHALAADDFAAAVDAADRQGRVRRAFPSVRVEGVEVSSPSEGRLATSAMVWLGALSPEDVAVELVARDSGGGGGRVVARMDPDGGRDGARQRYRATTHAEAAGRPALAVRVRARADRPFDGSLADLVVWA